MTRTDLPILDAGLCRLRPYRHGDEAAIAHHANDLAIWRNMRDRFPHPYTLAEAESWIRLVAHLRPVTSFAIEVDGGLVGGIGIQLRTDIERCGAEVGYWLGRAYWNRGIATAALRTLTSHVFSTFGELERLFALVFADNLASCRVLEKAGYTREALLRRNAIKEGRIRDQVLYARLRGEER
ncbi:MAG: GNAT family N-acetyltransferase [Myxococcaceae bacterium]|nr:GNAT family N-acetyltransferase [Myxococcaceae bacterium]